MRSPRRTCSSIDLMCEPRVYDIAQFLVATAFIRAIRGYALMAELAYPALDNGTAATPVRVRAPSARSLPVF